MDGRQKCISVGQVCASRGINVGHLHMSNGSNFLSQTIKCVSVTAVVTLSVSFSAFTHANTGRIGEWTTKYGTSNTSYTEHECALCHTSTTPPYAWNSYGLAVMAHGVVGAITQPNSNVDGDTDAWGQPCTQELEISLRMNPGISFDIPPDTLNCGSKPIAKNDPDSSKPDDPNFKVAAGETLNTDDPGVLENDIDKDLGNTKKVSMPLNNHHLVYGTITLSEDGSFIYTPDPGVTDKTDTFEYKVKDNTSYESVSAATVKIKIGKPICVLSSNENKVDFGANKVGSPTQSIDIKLINSGEGTCDVTMDAVPPTSNAFKIAASLPISIGSSAETTVTVSYSPSASVTDEEKLRFTTQKAQIVDIDLSGSGFYAPVITATDLHVNSTGYVTSVTPSATATDEEDGKVKTKVSSIEPPVTDNNYRPGRYTITYTAEDSNGHISTESKILDILPLIRMDGARMVGAGQTVEIPVTLNGNAPDNKPVIIQYQVSGTAPSSKYNITDGALTINSGDTGFLTVHTVDHSEPEPDGTIIITLSSVSSGNAVLSDQKTYTVVVTDNQISPVIDSLQISQSSVISQQVYRDRGAITVTANATDGNGNGDTLTYDWSASDAALSGVASGKIFTVDPSIPNNGTYTVSVAVSNGTSTVNQSIVLVLKTTAPTLDAANDSDSDGDSDEDGIKDAIEGRGDTDGDGMPDYLDPVNDPTLLNAFVSDSTPNYRRLLNTTAGLRLSLGMLALQAQDPSTGYVGAKIKTGDVKDISGTPVSDSSYDAVSGIYDFEIHGLSDAQRTAQIVIPLASSIPAGATVRKFADGTWYSFVENASDNIKSVASVNGECPIAGSSDYQAGLITFKNCLQLTMTDGGPNDADGQANGVISDPVTLAVPAEDNTPSAAPTSPPKSKSGGAIGLWWLLLGPVLVGMQRRKR